ncbi:AAA family ATPase [Embleya sp. NPDC127516]|uniref:helix-turn-helix transcriptional regulator n=1 Tax=Embleya sp. NPDC127516 TaxID=3363990 RepID=UPI003809E0B5
MKLVEREKDFSRLNNLMIGCRQGKGGVAVVTGPPGIGKTALLSQFTGRVTGSDVLLLVATGSPVEADLPFGLLSQLFHSAKVPDTIGEHVPRLIEEATAAGPETPISLGHPAYELFELFLRLAELQPLVVMVDDFQHADLASRKLLFYLANRLRVARILMICSDLNLGKRLDPTSWAGFVDRPFGHHVRLRALSPVGVANILEQRLGAVGAQGLGVRCHALSGGNPRLVHALVDDLPTTLPGAVRQADGVVMGESFREAVLACLHHGAPLDGEVARAIAVLGSPAAPALVGELIQIGSEDAAGAMKTLRGAGLLDGERFRHPAIEAIVLADHDFTHRADLSGQAANLLHETGASARRIAERLIAAEPVGQGWAVAALREAAEQAALGDEIDFAIECLNHARRCSVDEGIRATVTAELAQMEWRVDPSAAARHLTALTQALRDGHLGRRDGLALARHLLWHGRSEEAAEVIGLMFELFRATDEADRHAAAGYHVAHQSLFVLHPPAVVYAADSGLGPPLDPGHPTVMNPQVQAVEVLSAVLTGRSDESTVYAAEQVLQNCHLGDRTEDAMASALLALLYSDELPKARVWTDRLIEQADRRTAPNRQALLRAIKASVDFRLGDLGASADTALTALACLSPQSWGIGIGGPLAWLVLAETMRGDLDTAARYLAHPIPEAMYETRAGLHYLHARGRHHMAGDRPSAALRDFTACGELMRSWQMDLPALVPWRSESALAHLRLGRRRRARELAEEQLALTDTRGTRTHGISLRALAATLSPAERPKVLTRAGDLLLDSGDQLELAYCLADLGDAHQALGDPTRARMARRQATGLAMICGAEPLLRSAGGGEPTRPPTLSGPVRTFAEPVDTGSLSTAECRVGRLAVRGYTNRQIADELHITTGTVEQHLTRIYRKLNVKGRPFLPVALETCRAG